jgi:hypothetical protein
MFLRLKGGPAGKVISGIESQGTCNKDQHSLDTSTISFLKPTYWCSEDRLGLRHDWLRFPSRRRRHRIRLRRLLDRKDGVRIVHLML